MEMFAGVWNYHYLLQNPCYKSMIAARTNNGNEVLDCLRNQELPVSFCLRCMQFLDVYESINAARSLATEILFLHNEVVQCLRNQESSLYNEVVQFLDV